MASSNNIFVQSGFSLVETFVDKMKDFFSSTPTNVDFRKRRQSLEIVNKWVAEKTKGKISKMFKSLEQTTRLILLNAVHFKGEWEDKFDPEMTTKGDFFLNDGSKVKTDMMYNTVHLQLANINKLNAKAVKLPYLGDRFSMVIVLPNKIDGLPDVESELKSFDLSSIEFEEEQEVEIFLPKFKLESEHNLIKTLKAMDIVSLFREGEAVLTGLSPQPRLSVSSIMQKASIEVNERGSEASAASAAMVSTRSGLFSLPFACNHPVLYFIEDKETGLTLFIGRIVNPNKK